MDLRIALLQRVLSAAEQSEATEQRFKEFGEVNTPVCFTIPVFEVESQELRFPIAFMSGSRVPLIVKPLIPSLPPFVPEIHLTHLY